MLSLFRGSSVSGRRAVRLLAASLAMLACLATGAGGAASATRPLPVDPGSVARAQKADESRARFLRSDEARRKRASSRSAYRGLGRDAAVAALRRAQLTAIDAPMWRPTGVRSSDDKVRILDDNAYAVRNVGAARDVIVESTTPVAGIEGSGQDQLLDLALEPAPGGFRPRNPAAPLSFSADVAEGARLKRSGISIRPIGAAASTPVVMEDKLLWTNAYADTDLMVKAVPGGLETFHLLRSPDAPEQVRLDLGVPAGALLLDAAGGGWEVVVDGKVMATLSAVTAWDAQGQPVPVAAHLEAGALVMDVRHRGEDLAYPLTVDPILIENQQYWDGHGDADQVGWEFRSIGPVFTDHNGWLGKGRYMHTYAGWHGHAEEGTWFFQAPERSKIVETHFNYMHGSYLQPGGACVFTGVINTSTWSWAENHWGACSDFSDYHLSHSSIPTSPFQGHPYTATEHNQAVYSHWMNGSYNRSTHSASKMGGAVVHIADDIPPWVAGVAHQWRPETASGWAGSGEGRADIHGVDHGLGLKWLAVRHAGRYGGTHESRAQFTSTVPPRQPDEICTGDRHHRCPNDFTWGVGYSAANMPEGAVEVHAFARDAVGSTDEGDHGTDQRWTVKVDRQGPEISASGDLYQHRLNGPEDDETLNNEQYFLRFSATDGTAGSDASKWRSGVASARVEMLKAGTQDDWEVLKSYTNSSTGDNAALALQKFDFRPDAYAEGKRKLRIVARDNSGIESKEPFEIDIQRTPRAGVLPYYSMVNEDLTDRTRLSVNNANGNLLVRTTEFQLPGVGMDLVVGRVYNSWDSDTAGEFGPGWKLSYGRSTRLTERSNGDVEFRGPEGQRVLYRKTDSGYDRPGGVHAKLSKPDGGPDFKLDWYRAGIKWTFSSGGTLQKIVDRNDNTMRFDYYSSGRLQRIVNGLAPDGTSRRRRTIEIRGYNADGRITEIYDASLERTATFEYDANGRLSAAIDPLGKRSTFGYTAGGRLNRITDARGSNTTISYENLSQFPRVAFVQRTSDENGVRPLTDFDWDSDSNRDSERVELVYGPRSTSTNPIVTKYVTDELDRVEDVTDPANGDQGRGYDATGNVASFAGGSDATYRYNAAGENLEEVASGPVKTQMGYGDAAAPNLPTSAKDGGGRWQRGMTYDGGKDLVKVENTTSGAGTNSQASVQLPRTTNGVGTIDKITDPLGHSVDYQYTDEHELEKVIPQGRSETSSEGLQKMTYDAASRLRSVTDGRNRTATYTYDAQDRVISVTWASGAAVNYSYDANGNRLTMDDPRGRTAYTYDRLNRQLTEERGDQVVHRYTWDLGGNMASHTEGGKTTNYGYDARDMPSEVVDSDGKKTTFAYGEDDQKLKATRIEPDASGRGAILIDRDYDSAGRTKLIKATTRGGTVLEHFKYFYSDSETSSDTATGALKAYVRDVIKDQCVDFDYDSLNRLTSVRTTNDDADCDFDGDKSAAEVDRITYYYDKASNLYLRVRTQNGDSTTTKRTTYRVNERNELCWTVESSSSASCGSPPADATKVDVDAAGAVTRVEGKMDLDYNERGQTSSITPNNSTAAGQQYAGVGQSERTQSGALAFLHDLRGLTSVSSPSSATGQPVRGGTTRYVRGPNGSLISQKLPDGTTEYFIQDAHPGSVSALVTAGGSVRARFRYDPYGNVTSRTGVSDSAWRFAGAWFDRFPSADPAAQEGLYKIGERYYDPRTARWTQRDPIDQSGDLRQGNGYMYAAGDPVNITDPTGMFGLGDVVGAIGTAADIVSTGCTVVGLAGGPAGAGACAVGFGLVSVTAAIGSAALAMEQPGGPGVLDGVGSGASIAGAACNVSTGMLGTACGIISTTIGATVGLGQATAAARG